jgi:methylglutaconyl-CoA hydratase
LTLIEYSAVEGVAYVTLNRPEKRNALSPQLIEGLKQALDRAADRNSVRVVLLRGAGQDFCAGMDLSGLAQKASQDAMDYVQDAQCIADLYSALRRNPRPIIAAVQGRALGGGCGLATACDLIVAAESARFGYPEVNLGFVPAIVTALIRRSIGEKHAFELLATGEPLSAQEAQRIGMVNHVYADAEFTARAEEYAGKLAVKSASALALTKSQLYHIDGMNFETAIQSGVFANAVARGTADAKHGIEQFAKRKK